MTKASPRFKRIMLKLSGEALAGEAGSGIDGNILNAMASDISEIIKSGVQVALVIGGGNFVRGVQISSSGGMNRAAGDAMGMLGTVMNCLAMQDALDKVGCPSTVMSAVKMEPVCEYFDRRKALKLLNDSQVVLFGAGTGNPFFTTDTAAALRAIETECDVIIKATKVDGVYSADPKKDPTAVKFDYISCDEVLQKKLGVMDLTAITLCQDHQMPILVFKMEAGNLQTAVYNNKIGTFVSP
ncbi:MAG: UMP kinase [Fibrobacter sp.]|nr:UMP kinase [Fibrobacter sp.]